MGAYVVDMYIALAIIYWCINVILERVFAQIEKAYTPERKHRAVIKPAAEGEL
jgi:ABC-type arginine/histidine transport system permease subunit